MSLHLFPLAAIADNIVEAIKDSRRTILLLSPSYIQSEWTRFEYQVAQQQMLKLRHRILPIILRDLTNVKDDLDQNLKVILASVTYLEWPQDSRREENFWRVLERAMGTPPVKSKSSRSGRYSAASRAESVELLPHNPDKLCV